MKKILISVFLMSVFSVAAFAAKYKVNTSGKVTAPNGTHQNSSVLNNTTNIYSNYSAKNYVDNRQIQKTGVSTIDIVMDYSGSMLYWINEAKKTMGSIVSQLPAGTSVGFRDFGHNGGNNKYSPVLSKIKSITQKSDGSYKVTTKKEDFLGNISGSCSATAQIVRVAQNSPAVLLNGMNSQSIGGSTPMTLALKQAVESDFAGLSLSYPKKIVLITDGGENCGGDPCAFARNLVRQRKDVTIDVVLVSSSSTELKCISDATGGNFYNANDVSSFASSLYDSMTAPSSTPVQSIPQQKYEFVDD